MFRELKSSYSYVRVMFTLSLLSLLFGIGYTLLGELLLPFAIAALALLFVFENPSKRFLSYIIPALVILASVFLYGAYGLLNAQLILYALILAVCYLRFNSKAECSLYLTILISVFLILSFYLLAARKIESFSLEAIADFYSDRFTEIKHELVDYVSSYSVTNKEGKIEYPISSEAAAVYVDYFVSIAASLIGIVAFLISGVALKIFTSMIFRYSKNGILKTFSHFLPSSLTVYAFIVTVIISIFASTDSLFDIAILNASQILTVVFAYMGVKYVFMIGRMSNRRSFTMTVLLAALLLASSLAIQILSYLGAWVTLGTNRSLESIDKEQ